jgi:predicted ATPase
VADEVFGRDEELRVLTAFIEDARSTAGCLVLEGEPGIGKTTLWSAGVDRSAELGRRILSCRPIQTETPLAFAALADLLEPVLDDHLANLPPAQARALELAAARTGSPDDAPNIHTVAAATLSLVRAVAADGPVLLAVDDLPWTDLPSARVLEFVIRRASGHPIGLLATSRTEEHGTIDLRRALPPARLHQLRVGPLSVGAIQRLLREDVGVTFPRPLLLRIHRSSGGNPMLALEIGRTVVASGHEPSATEPLPISPTLSEAIRARLLRLGPGARRLLTVVAFLAQPTVDLVQAAMPDPEKALSDLFRAVRTGVLELSGDRIRFTHPLMAAEASAAVTPARRRDLHRHLAGIVASPEERARHLALSAAGPDEMIASTLESEAHDAYRRGAADAAVELIDLDRAHEARRSRFPPTPDAGGGRPSIRRVRPGGVAIPA